MSRRIKGAALMLGAGVLVAAGLAVTRARSHRRTS
jgi:hypothetical protein